MNFFGVIPARGGSKGILKKNLAQCAGKPLLAYSCIEALKSTKLRQVVVSTDDPTIAETAKSFGVEAPFLRPPELSQDDSPMDGVLQHALDYFEATGKNVSALVLLQPTSPLREAAHIDQAIQLFLETAADTLASVVLVPHQFNPGSLMKMEEGQILHALDHQEPRILRRQDKPLVYARNGPAILIVGKKTIREGKLYGDKVVGYVMGPRSSVDVDDIEDLQYASYLLERRKPSA